MSNKTILPCPCCGSTADVYKQGHREYGTTFSVECRGCGLRTRQYDSEDEAIELWNARIDSWIPCSEYKLMKAIEIVKEEGGIE